MSTAAHAHTTSTIPRQHPRKTRLPSKPFVGNALDEGASALLQRSKTPLIFGPNRGDLKAVRNSGLTTLMQAYAASFEVFTHIGNVPRSKDDPITMGLIDEAMERCGFAMQEIAAEMASRQPVGRWEAEDRARMLVPWYVQGGQWAEAAAVLQSLQQDERV